MTELQVHSPVCTSQLGHVCTRPLAYIKAAEIAPVGTFILATVQIMAMTGTQTLLTRLTALSPQVPEDPAVSTTETQALLAGLAALRQQVPEDDDLRRQLSQALSQALVAVERPLETVHRISFAVGAAAPPDHVR
ncbi:hypothetical protein BO86DRAFT_389859 [Aspergillus japonicus CBS 114.51]|uniref:Uncharacterized protein n=1 Tax=Aspergillus japonicus CBS 114.51 TaxID=1448312 RepID=A0A8T8WZ68_ASPJA|nr:hypothetical protein BO86DRAFT_389859 [Aspergillus japonicus CBS 114.51]RAH81147.1 hypothetical protein BO86DRAFT_389859 [Aspergillus japonicus CBS 114.51]